MSRSYTQQEVEEILRRAVAAQPDSDGLGHEELMSAAEAAGIDPRAVERAMAEIEHEQSTASLVTRVRKRRRERFAQSFGTYVLVTGFLAVADWMTGGGWWVQWVLLGWGLPIALQARRAFLPSEGDLHRSADREGKRLERQWRRRVRLAARERRSHSRRELEDVIQEGLAALLRSAHGRAHRAEGSSKGMRARVEEERRDAAPHEVEEWHPSRSRESQRGDRNR